MTIKNIGTKIVNIGTVVLMPDESMTANETICNAPAIKAMEKRGLLSIIKEVKAPVHTPAPQAPAQKPAAPKPATKQEEKAAAAPAAPAAPADQK